MIQNASLVAFYRSILRIFLIRHTIIYDFSGEWLYFVHRVVLHKRFSLTYTIEKGILFIDHLKKHVVSAEICRYS